MKFSVNINKFNDNLIKLRKELNKTLEKGTLNKGFKEKVLELEKNEEIILNELVMYYRMYASDIYKTKINVIPIKLKGSYKMNTYLKTYLKIDENTFIISDYNQEVHFLKISNQDDFEIELSHPVKNFNKFIVYMYPLSKEEILAFSATGEIFLFSIRELDDLFENINNLKITKIETNFKGFENVINLQDNKFLCQVGKSEICILEIEKESLDIEIKSSMELLEDSTEINSIKQISKSEFVAGTSLGDLIFGKFDNSKIKFEKANVLNMTINKVSFLENENHDNNICVALGKDGSFALYDLTKKQIVDLESKDFKGNLFEVQSKRGTGIVLSDDGYMYLLEENMGNWSLNKNVTLSGKYFLNILELNLLNYLAIDLYGNFYILDVDRLDSIEKLYNLSLYC